VIGTALQEVLTEDVALATGPADMSTSSSGKHHHRRRGRLKVPTSWPGKGIATNVPALKQRSASLALPQSPARNLPWPRRRTSTQELSRSTTGGGEPRGMGSMTSTVAAATRKEEA
ncbi:unnamed protein product, partial [Discosporangium mesarthrocarpum]